MWWVAHLFVLIFSLVDLFRLVTPKMEPFIVGGDLAKINEFPHSAYLAISCKTSRSVDNWSCGSSILNQRILLTAAHCLEHCLPIPSTFIGVGVGSEHKKQGITYKAAKYKLHPNYNPKTIYNDICLVKVANPMKLKQNVMRVVLMKYPPYQESASVAGWGLVDEKRGSGTFVLKSARQKVWNRNNCIDLLDSIPPGAICADREPGNKFGHAAEGDSGSALVVRRYIQIGLVSYKNPSVSKSVVVYTNVSYFLDWIDVTVKRLYCEKT